MMIEETLTIIRTYNAQTLKNFVVLCVVSSQVCISAISYPHSVDNDLYVVPDNIRSIDERVIFEGTERPANSNITLFFSDSLQRNLDKLERFSLFQENWNGYGAKPFSKTLLSRAENLIRGLSKQPELFPTADDSIQMEYDKEGGGYLEIQITDDDSYDVFVMENEDSEGENFRIEADVKFVNEQVKKFYAS